jgi:hypothetical protein
MGQLRMKVWVEVIGSDGVPQRREIATVDRSVDGVGLDALGLSLAEGKAIQCRLQEVLTQFQVDQASQHDRKCHHCGRLQGVHDYRSRTVHSLFGICRLRVPRLRSCSCGKPAKANSGNIETLLKGRATPELERVQAELGSRLSFREAARVLDLFVPTARPHNHRTVVNRLAKVADQIEKWDAASPYRMSRVGGSSISVFIDGAYIRAVPGYQSRHFEIAMGTRCFTGAATASVRGRTACGYRQARCGSCRNAGARMVAWPRRHCFQRRRRRAAKHRAQCNKGARDAYS